MRKTAALAAAKFGLKIGALNDVHSGVPSGFHSGVCSGATIGATIGAPRVALTSVCNAVFCTIVLAALLTGCGGRAQNFATVQDARAAGVFDQGRMPDVLPPSGGLIRVEAEADDGAYFHFSSADYAPMTAKLAPLATLPDDPMVQSWIKRKGLAGYAAFEHPQASAPGAARWLLVCSEPKGRCYARRLG